MSELKTPSEQAEKVFKAFLQANPDADMRAVPNQWVLNERALSCDLNEEITRLRAENTRLELQVRARDMAGMDLLDQLVKRGERMKALYDAAQYVDHDGRFDDWFDAETGEPK